MLTLGCGSYIGFIGGRSACVVGNPRVDPLACSTALVCILRACRLSDILRLRVLDSTELIANLALVQELDEHSEFLDKEEVEEIKEQKAKASQTQSTSERFKGKWRFAALA